MRADRNRLRANQAELLERTGLYKKDSTESAENVRQLTLTIRELKEGRPALVVQIKDQGIRPKDIQGVTTSVADAKADITASHRDRTRITDTIPQIISRIDWTDGYLP